MNALERAGHFIAAISWQELPAAVQEKARLCLVDNLGAALAGGLMRVSQIGAAYAAETWPGDQALILQSGQRAATLGAAFANGCASNALDIDDSARYAYGHAGAQIFPTALAAAQACQRSGAQLLTAIVVGYEIAHRVGRLWHATRQVYQACGSWGSVACAAVAAHLIGLPPAQAGQALSIAAAFAPQLPMMRAVDHPAMVKHGIEWAAMTGIISAELAQGGLAGASSLLSSDWSAGTVLPAGWGEDIGQVYLMVDGVAWKSAHYACCGWAHAGVEAARRLVQQHAIPLEQIAQIRVEGGHGALRLGARLPTTSEEAQFNQAWPLAAMLVDGEIGPAQLVESRLEDAQIRALAARVEVVETAELERLRLLFEQGHPDGRFASRVNLTLQNGQRFESGLVDGGLRFPPQGWDRQRMSEKFRWLSGFVAPSGRVEALLETCWHLDEQGSLEQFTRQLREIHLQA
jgi:2-methylcitrate dehydratase PrpD